MQKKNKFNEIKRQTAIPPHPKGWSSLAEFYMEKHPIPSKCFKTEKFLNLCTELSYLLSIDRDTIAELLIPYFEE